MIIILLIFFLILLFLPIGVRIIYDNKYSDVDVFIFKFIKYKFDLDSFIRKFIMDENDINKISFHTLLNNLELAINSKKLIKKIMKTIKVKKSTIIYKHDFEDYLVFIFYWNIVSRYKHIIRRYFKKVENEYYMINNEGQDISVELILRIKLINIFIVILKNMKEMIKVLKTRRRQKKHGTSNL